MHALSDLRNNSEPDSLSTGYARPEAKMPCFLNPINRLRSPDPPWLPLAQVPVEFNCAYISIAEIKPGSFAATCRLEAQTDAKGR